jgi:hypothetical protein
MPFVGNGLPEKALRHASFDFPRLFRRPLTRRRRATRETYTLLGSRRHGYGRLLEHQLQQPNDCALAACRRGTDDRSMSLLQNPAVQVTSLCAHVSPSLTSGDMRHLCTLLSLVSSSILGGGGSDWRRQTATTRNKQTLIGRPRNDRLGIRSRSK